MKLSFLKERQKKLIIQGFDSATQGLTEIVEFCKRLENAEGIFHTQGEVNHKKNQTVRRTPPIRQVGTEKMVKPGRKTLRRGCKQRTKKEKPTCVPSEWTWKRYELVQGHVSTRKSHEVDLVVRLWRRSKLCEVSGNQETPVQRWIAECYFY